MSKGNDLENDIILLHQLEEVIINDIEKSKIYPKVLYVWELNTNLLENYKTFKHIGLKPMLARGLVAEIMCKYVIKHWANERGLDCRILSNLLVPRVDGGTTQLDLLVISNDFAISVECKSLYGRLKIVNGDIITAKHTMSPWRQNYGHIMCTKPILNKYDLYFHNMVYIFSFGSIVEYEPVPENELMVNINSYSTLDRIARDQNFHHRSTLSKSQLDDIEGTLMGYIPEVEQEVEHIEFVKELVRDK